MEDGQLYNYSICIFLCFIQKMYSKNVWYSFFRMKHRFKIPDTCKNHKTVEEHDMLHAQNHDFHSTVALLANVVQESIS